MSEASQPAFVKTNSQPAMMTENNDQYANVVKRPAPRAGQVADEPATPAAQSVPAAPSTGTDGLQNRPTAAVGTDGLENRPTASALPWLIGGVCAGLLGVCVLAMILFSQREGEPVARVDHGQRPQTSSVNKANQQAEADRRRRAELRARLNNDRLTGGVAPSKATPDALTWDRDPAITTGGDLLEVDDLDRPVARPAEVTTTAPTDMPETTAEPEKPAVALAALPRAIALPRRKVAEDAPLSTSPFVLTRVEVENPSDVQLELVNDQLAGGSGRFELTARDGDEGSRIWDVQQATDGGPAKSVGAYTLADGELSFAWSPAADTEDKSIAQLENQPLRIIAGDETTTIAQRVATEVAPLIVKVDAGAIGTTTMIENPPENADVVVAIDELGDTFGEHSWAPSSTIEMGKSTDLRLGSDADTFQLALRITAEETSPGKVRIESRPMFRQGNTQKWDYFRPRAAAAALGSLKQQQLQLDAQMQQIQQKYRRNQTARDQATAIHNQQSALLLERIANLQQISDQCQVIQDKAELHFRIYAQSGNEQIDLVKTKSAADTDADEPMPPDENIGAPVDPNVGPPEEMPDE